MVNGLNNLSKKFDMPLTLFWKQVLKGVVDLSHIYILNSFYIKPKIIKNPICVYIVHFRFFLIQQEALTDHI